MSYVSLARLHTNKPVATRGNTSTWLFSTLSLPVQSEPRAKRTCLSALVDVKRPLIIFASTQSAWAETRFCCTNNIHTNKLKYVNLSLEKGGVRINNTTKSNHLLMQCVRPYLCIFLWQIWGGSLGETHYKGWYHCEDLNETCCCTKELNW